jgi:O-antigen ligase
LFDLIRQEKRSFGSVFLFQPGAWLTLGWVLFGLSWLLPNHYRPWVNFHSEVMAFGALAALMMGMLLTRPAAVRWPSVAGWILVAAILPWLQWVLGISLFAGDALLNSYYLLAWATAIFLGYHLTSAKDAGSVLAMMHLLWIAALLSAMIGLTQWLNLAEVLGIYATQTDAGDRAMGNLAQPNQLATLLLMGMVAYGYIFEQGVIGRLGFAMGISFMTAVLVLTQSRAGMIGVLAITLFFLMKRSHLLSRLNAKLVLAWALLFIAATALLPHASQALLISGGRITLTTTSDRILIWLQTLEGIRQAPWSGYGWNQTSSAQMVGALAYPGDITFSYAHNVLLDIVAWNGIPLGFLLIGLGFYWFCTRIYRVVGLEASYAMGCLLPFTIHSLVEFPFAYAYFLLVAGLMMGIVEASMGASNGWQINRRWSGSALAVWVVVGGYMTYEYLLIEEDFRIVRFENMHVGKTEASYQVPDVWMLSHMATMLKVARQPAVPDMTAQQLDDLRRVSSRLPWGALNLRYAIALGLNGDAAGARHMMAVVHSLYGEGFYRAAKDVWKDTADQYPQLGKLNP